MIGRSGSFANPANTGFAPVPVNLSGVSSILLRLTLNDSTNHVTPSFSTNGGNTFTDLPLPASTVVFTSANEAAVRVFGSGGVESPPPQPSMVYLSFVEGDPGIPGDGLFINATGGPDDSGSRDNLFEFSPLIPFDQFTDGFTFSVFAPLSIPDLQGPGFNIEVLGSSCTRWSFSAGALVTGRTVVNDVEGTYANISQSSIQSFVDFAKQNRPGCNISISNLFIEGISLVRKSALQTFTTLDAAAIGLGQNNFPGTPVP